MAARHCTMCALDWPMDSEYKVCPSCERQTDRISNAKAMPADEAKSEAAHYRFKRFYEKWDEEQPPERLNPEGAGSTPPGNEFASISRPEKPA